MTDRPCPMGLDLSLNGTAVCTLNGVPGRCAFERLDPGGRRGEARLHYLCSAFTLLVRDLKPDFAAVEGYAFAAKGRSHGTAEWGGVARLALYTEGVPFIVVPPTTLKKYVTGEGNAQKNAMMMKVALRWGFEAPDDDVCDAYALLRLADEWMAGNWTKKFQADVVTKVEYHHAQLTTCDRQYGYEGWLACQPRTATQFPFASTLQPKPRAKKSKADVLA